MIAESDASGTMLREYAYTRPEHGRARLAIIDSATAAIYPVVPDHLGTPVMITDLAGTPVWSADQLPFGQTTPPASNTISQHLRFPGQYSDTESGLHYNWHRYYDPRTGRYLRVDPIGLNGGLNVYRYVNQTPINEIDPEGLLPTLSCINKYRKAKKACGEQLDAAIKAFRDYVKWCQDAWLHCQFGEIGQGDPPVTKKDCEKFMKCNSITCARLSCVDSAEGALAAKYGTKCISKVLSFMKCLK